MDMPTRVIEIADELNMFKIIVKEIKTEETKERASEIKYSLMTFKRKLVKELNELGYSISNLKEMKLV